MTSSLGQLIQTPHGQTPQPFTKSYQLYARNLSFPISGNGPNFHPTQKEKNHPRSSSLPQTLYLQQQAKRCPLHPPLSISMATALIQDPITSELSSWNLLTTFPPPSLQRGHDQLPPVTYVSAHFTFSPDFKQLPSQTQSTSATSHYLTFFTSLNMILLVYLIILSPQQNINSKRTGTLYPQHLTRYQSVNKYLLKE